MKREAQDKVGSDFGSQLQGLECGLCGLVCKKSASSSATVKEPTAVQQDSERVLERILSFATESAAILLRTAKGRRSKECISTGPFNNRNTVSKIFLTRPLKPVSFRKTLPLEEKGRAGRLMTSKRFCREIGIPGMTSAAPP